MRTFWSAVIQQENAQLEKDVAAGKVLPQPDRITMALDLCELYGPEVDEACGAREPDVDNWEAGISAPTWEQVRLLAWLTGYPVRFFYMPMEHTEGYVIMCGKGGCEAIPTKHVEPYGQPQKIVLLSRQRALF